MSAFQAQLRVLFHCWEYPPHPGGVGRYIRNMSEALAADGHIVIAATAPAEASATSDEREKRIDDRAAHLSGYVLGTGIVLALGLYLFTYDGNVMFYIAFGSLLLSQLAEYAVQIKLHRTSIY